MLTRHPNYYPNFRCLGGTCPDTCCQNWDIVLDEGALADYQSAPPHLAQLLAQNLVTDQDGDACFRLDQHGMCAMLTEDGLCSIQKEWGEAHLCEHCAAYPRFIEEYGSLTETSLAISCPEAARLLLEQPHFLVEEYHDQHTDLLFPGIDPNLMEVLEQTRHQVLTQLNDPSASLWATLSDILPCAQKWQNDIEDPQQHSAPPVICTSTPATPSSPGFAQTLCLFFASLEPLRPTWPKKLRNCHDFLADMSQQTYAQLCQHFQTQFPQWSQHLKNFVSYLVFRHWHKTVNDDQLYGRTAFIACSAILLYHLLLYQWSEGHTLTQTQELSLFSAFSREVEHMEENLTLAIDTFSALSPADIHFPIS